MKLALASDIHLEFGNIEFQNTENADVLILSGDILNAQELHDFPANTTNANLNSYRYNNTVNYRNFLKFCSDNFKHVIYVAGNHELYDGKFNKGLDYLREETTNYDNIYFLEDETKKIDDILFIGCTLWTDLNKENPVTMYSIQNYMNDYGIIKNDQKGYRSLQPIDTLERHKQSLTFIKNNVSENRDQKIVLVTHMSPSRKSTNPRYKDDYHINGGYSSELDDFIIDNPQIKAWTHGHTHDIFDYVIGQTRILCNPRGYMGYEVFSPKFNLKYFDI